MIFWNLVCIKLPKKKKGKKKSFMCIELKISMEMEVFFFSQLKESLSIHQMCQQHMQS